jgi:3-dehydroquinate dehydratase type I
MICASIIESDVDSMLEKANSAGSDVVELRLDYLSRFQGLKKLRGVKKKRIVTCMPSWEGGKFRGSEEERAEILMEALAFAEFITLELGMEDRYRNALIGAAKERGVKVIIACHDLNSTPERKEIIRILNKEKNSGADIAKIAFKANNYKDAINLMDILADKSSDKEFGIPIIALSMGRFGRISRILAPLLGSYLTFASAEEGRESAEGQLTVEELKEILKILK